MAVTLDENKTFLDYKADGLISNPAIESFSEEQIELFKKIFIHEHDTYFILFGVKRDDFIIINLPDKTDSRINNIIKEINSVLNIRGDIVLIEEQHYADPILGLCIWIRNNDDNQVYLYLLMAYDFGIIQGDDNSE